MGSKGSAGFAPFPKMYPNTFNKKLDSLTRYHTVPTFNNLGKNRFENIVGKGENAGNKHFLLFPQCFLPIPKRICLLKIHIFCRLQMFSIWTSLNIFSFGKALTNDDNLDGTKFKASADDKINLAQMMISVFDN